MKTGPRPPAGTSSIRRVFFAGLGLVYGVAFVSLWAQIHGLIGTHGILPAPAFLDAAASHLGVTRLWRLPTVAWLTGGSDGALDLLCACGTTASLFLALGVAPPLSAVAAWILYLSLCTLGQVFLSFQWDILLLEAGFLGILYTPLAWTPRAPAWHRSPRPVVTWLLRLLIAKLMFLSGVVKLSGGDPTWRHLTALTYHYETTCLPTWTGWYMHALPPWFHQMSAATMFLIELVLPFGAFGPRPLRLLSAAGFTLLMLFIGATGNYGFFIPLVLVLCLPLLDDDVLPRRLREPRDATTHVAEWPRLVIVPIAGLVLVLTTVPVSLATGVDLVAPGVLRLFAAQSPFHLVSGYGLFAHMTTTRPEIIVEGSDDDVEWRPYEFRWKPGDPKRRPAFVQPHMPRLDWQMWFAALGSYRSNPWFLAFCERLLQGSPPVLALLGPSPFPDRPPRYLRTTLYDYRFTTPQERQETGAWWTRRVLRPYTPRMMLAPDGQGLIASEPTA